MAGWDCRDEELIEWDGSIKAKKGFVGDGSKLINIPAGAETDPVWLAASNALYFNVANISGGLISLSGALVTTNANIISSSNALVITNSNLTAASAAYYTHAADASNPHGVSLTQTNLVLTSGAIAGDWTTSGAVYIPNILYNTTSGGITASNYPIGSLLVVYS